MEITEKQSTSEPAASTQMQAKLSEDPTSTQNPEYPVGGEGHGEFESQWPWVPGHRNRIDKL